MAWTKKLPKNSGIYWVREVRRRSPIYGGKLWPATPPFVVKMDEDGDIYCHGSDTPLEPGYGDYWWWTEPITCPSI